MDVTGGALNFRAGIDDSDFNSTLAQMRRNLSDFNSIQKNQAQGVEDFAKRAAQAAAGFLSIQAATGFINKMIEVRGAFQQIEVAFTTMLKSKDEADKLMAQAVQLAAVTPFTLQEVASGAKQLLAYGFAAKDVTKNLEMLGNIASGVGSQLGDVVYLYGTLKASGRVTQMDINQFAGRGIPIYQALADVMKINVDQVRDYVSAGKVGFPQVEQAFKGLTSQGGQFFNLMKEQSKTLTGQLSNLEDAVDRAFNALGKENQNLFAGGIEIAIDLVNNYQKIIDIVELLITIYGSYRAALVLQVAISKVVAISNAAQSASHLLLQGAVELQTAAEALLNTEMAKTAVLTATLTAAIAAIALAIYAFTANTNAQVASQKALNDVKQEAVKNTTDEIEKLNSLRRVIENTNRSEADRLSGVKELRNIMGERLKQYSDEEIKAGDAAKAIDNYAATVVKNARVIAAQGRINDLQAQLLDVDPNSKIGNYKDRVSAAYDAIPLRERAKLSLKRAIGLGADAKVQGEGEVREYREYLQAQINKLQDVYQTSIDDLNAKTGQKDDAKPIITKNAEYFKKIIKENTESLEGLDKSASDFKTKAAKYKSTIQAAQKQLLAFSVKDPEAKKASNEREQFFKNLSELEQKSLGKTLSDNEEALKQIHDKYEAEREKAKKIKGVNAGVFERINRAEENEAGAKIYEQKTEKLKQQLEIQRNLQIDYENYVEKFGIDAANNKYAELRKSGKSYIDDLRAEQKKITDIPEKQRTGNETDRLKAVTDLIGEEQRRQAETTERNLQQALQASQTYNTARLQMLQDYEKQKAIIETSADVNDRAARLEELRKQTALNLDALAVESLERQDAYRDLFDNIDNLSTAQAKKDIQHLREMASAALALGKISPEAYQKFMRSLNEADARVNDKLPAGLQKIASEFSGLSSEVSKFDQGLGNAIGSLGSILNLASSVKANINNLKAPDSDIYSKIGSGIALLSAGISVVQGIVGLFSNAKEKAEQQKYATELQLAATEAVNKALERQLQLTKEIYGPERIEAYKKSLEDIKNAQDAANASLQGKLALTGNKIVDDNYIKKLNNGERPNYGAFNKYKDDIENAKNAGLVIDLTNKSLEELNRLLDEKRLDEKTASIVQSLIDLKQQYRETQNELNEEVTGINFDSLSESIRAVFDSGEASVEKFADAIEKSIKGAFSNAFKRNEIDEAMQPFYDQLAQAGDDGVFTQQEIDQLRAQKDSIAKLLADKAKAYQAIIGSDDSVTDDNATTLKNSFQGMTTQQADLLAGQYGGQRLAQLENNRLVSESGLTLKQIADQGDRKLTLLNQITINTGVTAENSKYLSRLEEVAATLSSIDKKTGAASKTAQANGIPG